MPPLHRALASVHPTTGRMPSVFRQPPLKRGTRDIDDTRITSTNSVISARCWGPLLTTLLYPRRLRRRQTARLQHGSTRGRGRKPGPALSFYSHFGLSVSFSLPLIPLFLSGLFLNSMKHQRVRCSLLLFVNLHFLTFAAASMTLILGFYGSANLVLGPNSSRILNANSLFVQDIKVRSFLLITLKFTRANHLLLVRNEGWRSTRKIAR